MRRISLSERKLVEHKMQYLSEVVRTSIESEQKETKKALERKENPPRPGIRGRIKQLIDLDFPEEEIMIKIKKEYNLKYEDRYVVLNILNDVKKEKRSEKKLKEIENER